MHPLARDLYKRVLVAGREYPGGLDWVRESAKREFRKNAALDPVANAVEFRRAVAAGRYYVREIEAVARIKKYRAMKSGKYYGGEGAA